MAWTYYPLKFRLLSPLHIGYRKVGNLMQTRSYVPGKNLWAALTARMTRDNPDVSKRREYKNIGENLVKKHFRFGYLWPSLDGIKPYFPWEHNDFDYLFLDSYTSTALDYTANAAQEGSLHETELIAPAARPDGSPVYLLGDLWVMIENLPADLRDWQEALKNIQLGGERTYGWGRLACCSDWNNIQSGCGRTIAGHEWQETSKEIVLTLNKGDNITAHALACGPGAATSLTGSIEPLVGREWGEFAGQYPKFGGVYFAPESRVVDPGTKFKIGNNGRWEYFGSIASSE